VQEDWRDFVQAHCLDCAAYMERMDSRQFSVSSQPDNYPKAPQGT
jgi:hypothetical protein